MKVEEGRRVGQKRKAKRRRKGAEMGCGGKRGLRRAGVREARY